MYMQRLLSQAQEGFTRARTHTHMYGCTLKYTHIYTHTFWYEKQIKKNYFERAKWKMSYLVILLPFEVAYTLLHMRR